MADERLRNAEREAANGDPEARRRLEHERCRADQCCAHSHTVALPPLAPEAHAAMVWIEDMAVPDMPIGDLPYLSSRRHVGEVSFTMRIAAHSQETLMAAADWMRRVFPLSHDPQTGLMPTGAQLALGRILYGDKCLPPKPQPIPGEPTRCTAPTPGDETAGSEDHDPNDAHPGLEW